VNKDKIFELFEGENEISPQELSSTTLDEMMKHPYAKIGMFTKLIINHFVFHQKLQKFFEKEGAQFDIEKTKEASEFTVYNRAWSYIKQVNVEDEYHIKAIEEFEPITFNKALQNSIWYFEDREEYEKCAHILKIKKIVNTFKDSLD